MTINFYEMLKSVDIDLPTAIIYTIILYICIAMFKYFLESFFRENEESIQRADKLVDVICEIKEILSNDNVAKDEKDRIIYRKSIEIGKLVGKNEYLNIREVLKKDNVNDELQNLIEKSINYKTNILNSNNSFINNFENFIKESRLRFIIKSLIITLSILYFSLLSIILISSSKGKPIIDQIESFAIYGLIMSFLMSSLMVIEILTTYLNKNNIRRILIGCSIICVSPLAIILYFGESNNTFDGIILVIIDILYLVVTNKILKKIRVTSNLVH